MLCRKIGEKEQEKEKANNMASQSPKSGGGGHGGRSIPPPTNTVAPKGIGPIETPNKNDVLSGRGGRINAHAGNVQFREIINSMKAVYLSPKTKKLEKAHIANEIVRRIRALDPPGRFLKEEKDGMWWDIGDEKARKKVGQALREDAPDIRPNLEGGGAGGAASPRSPAPGSTEKKGSSNGDGTPALVSADGTSNTPQHNQQQPHSPDNLYPGPPPVGPYRTPSFTSGRGMGSPRGSSGGKGGGPGRGSGGYAAQPQSPYGHPPSPYGYHPQGYDPAQQQGQGWYPQGGGVPATQGPTNRNPSEMTFAGKTFHPTESGASADVSDISELSLNVGASLMSSGAAGASPTAAAASPAAQGASKDAALQFSHRSAWQHNQLRSRAERYAQQAHNIDPNFFPPGQHPGGHPPHPAGYSPHGQPHQQQHQQHHPGGGQMYPHPELQQSSSMGPMGSPPTSRYAQLLQSSQNSSGKLKISDKSNTSRVSDLSMSFGLSGISKLGSSDGGRLARSLSLPGIKSGDLMSLGEASFHALLEDAELANYDAELRKNNPTLGYTGVTMDGGVAHGASVMRSSNNSGGSGKKSNSSGKSNVSALSNKSNAEASQKSNISMAEVSAAGSVRSSASSWMKNYKGQDVGIDVEGSDMLNPWMAMEGTDQFSTNSIMSEISTELMALDLAESSTLPRNR